MILGVAGIEQADSGQRETVELPAGVKSNGKSENIPETLAKRNVRKWASLSTARRLGEFRLLIYNGEGSKNTHVKGTRTSKIAFSCTCQPNMKDE